MSLMSAPRRHPGSRRPVRHARAPASPLGCSRGWGRCCLPWKAPCRFGGAWNDGTPQFLNFCYTDIYPLWWNEKLDQGLAPYFGHEVEYPVGIGSLMWIIQKLVSGLNEPGVWFYDLTVLVMAASLIVGVLIMASLAGMQGRPWDTLWYALAPALILTAFINWDLLCGALSLGAFLAWARGRHVLAGVLLGLAIATKFYPVVFFGPLFLLALRTRRLQGTRFISKTFTSAKGLAKAREHPLDAEQIKRFAAEFDPQAFHLDEEAAEGVRCSAGLAASGWHTAALTMRLLVESVPLADGLVGAELQIAWPRPTRPGMTLRVFSEVDGHRAVTLKTGHGDRHHAQ